SMAIDNYIYTMERLRQEGKYDKDEFIVLLPTAPFRHAEDIDQSVRLFYEKDADSVISCKRVEHPIEWVCQINDEGRINRNRELPAVKLMNRQASEENYIPNGAIYVLRHSLLKKHYSYYTDRTYGYVMPEERSLDIDTLFDF